MTPLEVEGLLFVFSTCAADCGNVLGPCPKVIGTGPTVLRTFWIGATKDRLPGGRSVRTPTLRERGDTGMYEVLRGVMVCDGVLRDVTVCDGVLWQFTEFDVKLRLVKFIRV